MKFSLRDYQEESRAATTTAMLSGGCPLAVMATGLGKTEVIIAVIRDLLARGVPNARVLVLADRDHLVENLADRFILRAEGLRRRTGVVKAEKNDSDRQIVFASVQTLDAGNRLEELLSHGGFGYVFFDEAHRSVTPQALRVIERLKAAPEFVSIAGCTATPNRTDGEGLVELFDQVVPPPRGLTINWGINKGWLVPVRNLDIAAGVRFRGRVATRYGDYATSDVAKVFDVDNVLELIVATHKKIDPELKRQGIAFVPSVDMAYRLADAFSDAGIAAEAADGSVGKADRAEILDRFRAGSTRLLVCYPGLWGEGLDLPELSIVHMAFPTKSAPRWQQCVGRGLRTAAWAGKEDCVIVNYVPNDDNKVTRAGNVLLGDKERQLVDEENARKLDELAGGAGIINGWLFDGELRGLEGDPMAIIVMETSFIRDEEFAWKRISNERILILGLGPDQNNDSRSLVIRPTDEADHYAVDLVHMPDYNSGRQVMVIPIGDGDFENATEIAKKYADYNANTALASKKAKWRDDPISEGQIRMLGNYRNLSYVKRLEQSIKTKADLHQLTKGAASDLITQVKTLQALG